MGVGGGENKGEGGGGDSANPAEHERRVAAGGREGGDNDCGGRRGRHAASRVRGPAVRWQRRARFRGGGAGGHRLGNVYDALAAGGNEGSVVGEKKAAAEQEEKEEAGKEAKEGAAGARTCMMAGCGGGLELRVPEKMVVAEAEKEENEGQKFKDKGNEEEAQAERLQSRSVGSCVSSPEKVPPSEKVTAACAAFSRMPHLLVVLPALSARARQRAHSLCDALGLWHRTIHGSRARARQGECSLVVGGGDLVSVERLADDVLGAGFAL